jgi:putative effector of murein hydrolase
MAMSLHGASTSTMGNRTKTFTYVLALLFYQIHTTCGFVPGGATATRWRVKSIPVSPGGVIGGTRQRGLGLKPTISRQNYPATNDRAQRLQSTDSSASASLAETSKGKLHLMDQQTTKALVSAAAFCVLDIVFRRSFAYANISFPSSLAGCAFLFCTLLALPGKTAESTFQQLTPGAGLLAKWLPVFFVPSLVTLPLAQSMGAASELLKAGIVVVGGFFFTLLTTSYAVVAVRKSRNNSDNETAPPTGLSETAAVMETVVGDAAQDVAEKAENVPVVAPPKVFSNQLFQGLVALTLASGAASAAATTLLGLSSAITCPLTTLFMLATTLASFVFAARLPKRVTKIVHPLVTCTAVTWTIATGFGTLTGRTFKSMLKSYRTGSLSIASGGAGDILLFLLGPAVVSLAISMYDRRQLMRENLREVGTSVAVSTLGGLFGTALAVRLLGIGNPSLRLSLLSRNITSPLAMAIAGILGADESLAVSMVVVTGLLGANFGASILSAFGIKDSVARGLGIGAAAHGLGTAAFVNEKDAFPFAAIGMALTASAATVVVSIPILRRVLLQIALGW